mgnify:CR=1 FL=1
MLLNNRLDVETIFALATAQGKAGLAVVRISGPLSLDILARYCGSVPANGRGLHKIVDADGQMIDEARAREFQDPTREPEPPVLLIDELQQQQFQEIFLAPDIDPRTTSKEELMRAVSAARVGLYLIKQPTQG